MMHFLGIPVVLDTRSSRLATARGLWPFKKIAVSPAWQALPPEQRQAVLYHEAAHCKGAHLEMRITMLVLAATPFLALVPWRIVLAVVLTGLAWEACAWVARRQEIVADEFAAINGFGPDLAAMLEKTKEPESAFYPGSEERIRKLREYRHAMAQTAD